MKKLFVSSLFLLCAAFTFAQSNQLDISYEKIKLKLDNEIKHELEVFDLSLIRLNIVTKQALHIEDFKIKIDNSVQKIDEKIQLIEVNPSEKKMEKTYQLIFKLDIGKNKLDIDFVIKNHALDHSMKIQFYSNRKCGN